MNREVHVRFWERPEVRILRATRQPLTQHQPTRGSGDQPYAEIYVLLVLGSPASRSNPTAALA